jgi:hypothetical protein
MQNADIALLALIALTLLATIVAVPIVYFRNRRRVAALNDQFGLEYARAVVQYGTEAEARHEVQARLQRASQAQRRLKPLKIRLLSADQCARFGSAWRAVQRRFANDPQGALVEANGLVKDVMRIRGYPIGDVDLRSGDLSKEHANVLEHYRAARELALANASGDTGPEDLRLAMAHYRALFHDLLQFHLPEVQLNPVRT